MNYQDRQGRAEIQTWQLPEAFRKTVRGGISLRADGAMSWGGDEPEKIVDNRVKYFEKKGLSPRVGVAAEQVHGNNIYRVMRHDAGRGILERENRIPATDGLITDAPGIVLTTLHADCAPIYYADPKSKAIGLAHAGWRGILAGLPGKMLIEMEKEFGSKREDILVAVGPLIGTEQYAVDPERAEAFRKRFQTSLRPQTPPDPPVNGGVFTLDLFAALVNSLLESGLDPNKLPPRPPCTATNPDFASYRRDGPPAKSMLAWLLLDFGV